MRCCVQISINIISKSDFKENWTFYSFNNKTNSLQRTATLKPNTSHSIVTSLQYKLHVVLIFIYSSSPCVNGATCRNVSSGVFTCNCARGYYTDTCRYYNPCSQAPCVNGGVCVHTEHDAYTCVCAYGYSRTNCEYFDVCRFVFRVSCRLLILDYLT